MKIETGIGTVNLIAKDEAEAALLAPIEAAINAEDSNCPACLVDSLENGTDNRIINGVLTLQVGGE